jgi:hypothetical protein
LFEIKKYFNSVNPNSKANQFRKKRFELFLEVFYKIISTQNRVDILDVGGLVSVYPLMVGKMVGKYFGK